VSTTPAANRQPVSFHRCHRYQWSTTTFPRVTLIPVTLSLYRKHLVQLLKHIFRNKAESTRVEFFLFQGFVRLKPAITLWCTWSKLYHHSHTFSDPNSLQPPTTTFSLLVHIQSSIMKWVSWSDDSSPLLWLLPFIILVDKRRNRTAYWCTMIPIIKPAICLWSVQFF
jgi:hypothetical protein